MRRAFSNFSLARSSLESQAQALWSDHQYAAAAALIDKHRHDAPPGLLDRALRLKDASEHGSHDVSEFYLKKRAPDQVADYVGPLEIRWSKEKGRGVFITADARVGDLLFVNNAAAVLALNEFSYDFESMKASLVGKLLEQCGESPRLAETVRSMHRMNAVVQHLPAIGIFSPNSSFDCSNFDTFELDGTPAWDEGTDFWGTRYFGSWPLLSLINHSCCEANVSATMIGNACFGYASRDVAAGSELLRGYLGSIALKHYSERVKLLPFPCDCPRCSFEKRIFDNRCFPAEMSDTERAWLIASMFDAPGSHRDDRGEWLEICGDVSPGSFLVLQAALSYIADRPDDDEMKSRMMELARKMAIQACGRQKEEVIQAIIQKYARTLTLKSFCGKI